MPKVTIREFDRTGSNEVSYLDYTVLVPGVKVAYTDATDEEISLDGLYEDFKSFQTAYANISSKISKPKESGSKSGSESESNSESSESSLEFPKDYGLRAAGELLKCGLSVQYVGAYENAITEDGATVTITLEKGTEKSKAISDIFSEFEDKSKYDLRFIYLGGFCNTDSHDSACTAAITCAGNRGDALAVIAAPYNKKKAADINTWINTSLSSTLGAKINRKGVTFAATDNNESYGQYAAIFTPQLKTSIVDINNKAVSPFKIDAAWNYLSAFAKQLGNYAPWYATAGSLRGGSSYNFTPMVKYGESDIDLLQKREYSENTSYATNLVTEIRPYGNILWGNRTMCPLDSTSTQLRAASFLNIRQLCITLKKTLYRAARRFTYEPNSDVLWVNFKSQITPLLDEMKANQGIRGYQLSKLSTNKKAVLAANIKIIPIEAVEDFDLTIELTDSIEVSE